MHGKHTASARTLQVLTAELEDLRLTLQLLRQRMRSLEQQARAHRKHGASA